MKKLITMFLFCLMAIVSFTSCTKDDDNTNNLPDYKSLIVGTWQITHAEGFYAMHGHDTPVTFNKDIDIYDKDLFIVYEFNPTGEAHSYDIYEWYSKKDLDSFLYVILGNRLRVYEDVEPWTHYENYGGVYDCNIDNTFTILELTTNTLVLKLESKDSNFHRVNNMTDQYVIATFKKIR